MRFVCNVCGAESAISNPAGRLGRETASCLACGSSVRQRSLAALLSQEIFGISMALPEFPALKGIRGIGMSDTPELARRLAEKFDYSNTFYHQAPRFDVTNPDQRDLGRYDFILSSEVMEHVPPPVECAFHSLASMLKPDGLLLMTTPYGIGGETKEHFPELYEYALAAPGGKKTVLVNRRRDGSLETFENLVFHGGQGSTLEMRLFTEAELRTVLGEAGFREVHFASENWPEFGVEHAETWSLPIVARKGHFHAPAAELATQYREACRLAARKIHDLDALTAEYERHIAFHRMAYEKSARETEQRIAWLRKVESEWEDRTQWALDLEKERKQAAADFERARAEIERLNATLWMRLGRRLRAVD